MNGKKMTMEECIANPIEGEIWWFYPSRGSNECDRYILDRVNDSEELSPVEEELSSNTYKGALQEELNSLRSFLSKCDKHRIAAISDNIAPIIKGMSIQEKIDLIKSLTLMTPYEIVLHIHELCEKDDFMSNVEYIMDLVKKKNDDI